MRIIKVLFFFLVLGIGTSSSIAQNLGSSPYSRLGIGDMADPSFSRNAGLGGAGVALSHSIQLNSLNPASLAALKATNFEFGIMAKKNKLFTANDAQYGTAGNIHHISLAMPLHKRYVVQFGARPFSSVNYASEFSDNVSVPTKVFNISLSGSGGLSEFFFGNAYNHKDWLMVGLNVGYITGQTNIQRSITDIGNIQSVTQDKRNETYVRVSPGILITKKLPRWTQDTTRLDSIIKDTTTKIRVVKKLISDEESKDWFVGLGITGSFYHTANASEALYYKRLTYDPSGAYYLYSSDTLSSNGISNYSIPTSIRAGVSLFKPNKITYVLDYYYSNWASFRPEQGVAYRVQQTLAAGIEYIPEFGSTKMYKRIAYRMGGKLNSLPYSINGQSISQWQVNVGTGINLPRKGGYNVPLITLNLSLAYGQMGTTSDNLIKENYWLFTLGVISNSKWFLRPKHD